jgi:general secretion pathway protein D
VTTFTRRVSGALAIAILVASCAADRLHREGLAAIDSGNYELGVSKLDAAAKQAPRNMGFRLDLQARREAAVQSLIRQADAARAARQLDTATQLYRRVLSIEPGNDRATHGLTGIDGDARHGTAVAEARKDFERKDYDTAEAKLRGVLSEDPGYTPAQDLAAAITVARGQTTVAPRLKTRDNRKVTLQFRDAPTKMVFEVLSRETGINFILDKDIKSEGKTTIFVQDVAVEEAIDLVLDQNSLARQILSSNMVIIYPNTATKQKEYEQQIVRTFYLTNAEPKDVESMLKSVLGAKNMFVDERSGSVIVRDTPDTVRMAEKLVASLDVAEPEVMLEVEVLEISSNRLQDLGIQYPTSATLAPSPLGLAAGGAVSKGLVLSDLAHQSSDTITITPLSVTLNAMKQAGMVNTLASPRVRARNKEKAKILIGSRLPVITTGVTSIGGGSATTSSSNVQYLDVGLTLDVQPTVHLDSDVAIKLNLEVSSVLKQVTIPGSGTIAYEIGTRNANTLLRLKDGETQILAGLIQDTDTRSTSSIPGLGDVPIIGRLFGTHHTDREKDEIVLSITPRIIRMQPRPASDMTEFWYGSESRTRTSPYSSTSGPASPPTRFTPTPAPIAAPESAPGPAGTGLPNGPSPQPVNPSIPAGSVSAPLSGSPPQTSTGAPQPNVSPRTALMQTPSRTGLATTAIPTQLAAAGSESEAPVESAPQESADTATAQATAPAHPVSAPPATHSAISLNGPSSAKVGDEFEVVMQLSTPATITRLRSQLRFEPAALQLVSANAGDAVPAAAGNPSVDMKGGGAQLDVTTTPDDPVQGTGSLMVLRFRALAARPATNIAAMVNVLGGTGAAVGSSSAQPLKVAIQP